MPTTIEALGSPDDEPTRTPAAERLDARLEARQVWGAAIGGELVSASAFDAALPDIVQLGGSYTRPPQRGRNCANTRLRRN